MKKIRKQKRFQFIQDKQRPPQKDGLQVSRYISKSKPYVWQEVYEAVGDRNAQFSEIQDQDRDKKLVDNIQKAIEREKSLSVIHDNVEVMANSGVVTLEGIVFSEQEKVMVGEKAAIYAGTRNIRNNLDVVSNN